MIKEIQIQNFKCFARQSIQCGGLTVFAGINGVGKSTVIQALLIFRQTVDKIRQFIVKDGQYFNEKLNIEIKDSYGVNIGNSKDITSVLTDSDVIRIDIMFDNEIIQFSYLASTEIPEPRIDFIVTDEILGSDFVRFSFSSIFAKTFHYLMAERIGPRDFQLISGQESLNTGYKGEYTAYALCRAVDIKSVYYNVEEAKCIKSSPMLFQKQVEAWMDFIVPGVEIHPELFGDINLARVGMRKKASQTNYLNSVNMGFGITYVLPIVVSCLLAEKDSVVIIENPEAHLHPKGQSKIGQFLAQMAGSGIQIILETHSEHIINGIRIGVLKKIINNADVAINFFNQDAGNQNPIVKSIQMNQDADLSEWPNGFFDQEEYDLAEIFKLKRRKVD